VTFASDIRSGLKIIDKEVKSVEEFVTHFAWVSQDGFGEPTYDPPAGTPRRAIVQRKNMIRKLPNGGQLVAISASVFFVLPFADQGTPGRQEPLDPRDKIKISGVMEDDLVWVGGLQDPGTSRPFYLEAWIGAQ
jgi:hypothetical protein